MGWIAPHHVHVLDVTIANSSDYNSTRTRAKGPRRHVSCLEHQLVTFFITKNARKSLLNGKLIFQFVVEYIKKAQGTTSTSTQPPRIGSCQC